MSVVLASAWYPRGELSRFLQVLPHLKEVYAGLVISLPPESDEGLVNTLLEKLDVSVIVTPDWSWGRYAALHGALEVPATHVQYVDFDRLLRWVETKPGEWRHIIEVLQDVDCLIVGRTEAAYRTHPKALVLTESISNMVTSYLLGRQMDVSAGCKSFNHKAVKFLLDNCEPGCALGTDAEWPILLQRAGFKIDYVCVDGLDWEIPDQYQKHASDEERQRQQACLYDTNPTNWESRVKVAHEIVQVGLEAYKRKIVHLNHNN